MKRVSFGLILLVCAASCLTGCKTTQAPSSTTANAPPASSNSNASDGSNKAAQPSDAARNSNAAAQTGASAETRGGPKLVGAYKAHEVQDKGVVTVMSAITTVIYFSPEGTYSRVSEAKGKIYHRDSGQFRIQAPDKLLLTIQMSDRKIQSPPLERTHTFSLSSDGEELKLTSGKGSVAVFRRAAAPAK